MTIIIARELMCDDCGEWMRLQAGGITDTWPKLKKEGWTRAECKHYCPACSKPKEEQVR